MFFVKPFATLWSLKQPDRKTVFPSILLKSLDFDFKIIFFSCAVKKCDFIAYLRIFLCLGFWTFTFFSIYVFTFYLFRLFDCSIFFGLSQPVLTDFYNFLGYYSS